MGTRWLRVPMVLAALVAVAALTANGLPGHTTVPGETAGRLRVAGKSRSYRLFVPPGLPAGARVPLLVLLHPAGGSADGFVATTRMDSYAARDGFVTVAPQGLDGATWDAGSCCGGARDEHVDDVGFVAALLSHVDATAPVDSSRVYVAGASNGGMLGYRLACDLAPRITAVFSAAGDDTTRSCHPSAPVSIVEFHSVSDALVPAAGGVRPQFARPLTRFVPLLDTFARWAARDGCTSSVTDDVGGGEQVTRWTGCDEGTELAVYLRRTGGGHEWPSAPDAPVDASQLIAQAITTGALVRRG